LKKVASISVPKKMIKPGMEVVKSGLYAYMGFIWSQMENLSDSKQKQYMNNYCNKHKVFVGMCLNKFKLMKISSGNKLSYSDFICIELDGWGGNKLINEVMEDLHEFYLSFYDSANKEIIRKKLEDGIRADEVRIDVVIGDKGYLGDVTGDFYGIGSNNEANYSIEIMLNGKLQFNDFEDARSQYFSILESKNELFKKASKAYNLQLGNVASEIYSHAKEVLKKNLEKTSEQYL
jgi:hypothetical protein